MLLENPIIYVLFKSSLIFIISCTALFSFKTFVFSMNPPNINLIRFYFPDCQCGFNERLSLTAIRVVLNVPESNSTGGTWAGDLLRKYNHGAGCPPQPWKSSLALSQRGPVWHDPCTPNFVLSSRSCCSSHCHCCPFP